MYCWEIDHYLKRHCQVSQDDLSSNWINLENKSKICLGAYKPEIWSVYIKQKKLGRKSVANVKKLWYLSLPLANVQLLRIRELESDPYFSNKEIKYVFLNAFMDKIRVLTTQTNQSSAKQLAKIFVKRIWHQHIEKKKDYAAPTNIWFGEWKPVKEDLIPTSFISILLIIPKIAMLDANTAVIKKIIKQKKLFQLVNVLKEFVEAIIITNYILDKSIQFCINTLISWSLWGFYSLFLILYKIIKD